MQNGSKWHPLYEQQHLVALTWRTEKSPPLLFTNFSIYHLFLVSQTVATSKPRKLLQNPGVLYIEIFNLLSQRRAFFDNWTSKIGRSMQCFVHFDSKIKFALRQSGVPSFGIWTAESDPAQAFWFVNALCATAACHFWTGQLQKVPRTHQFLGILTYCAWRQSGVQFSDILISKGGWSQCVLHILAWKCASCHSGVQFFISPLKTWVRTRRFSEPTFRPSRTHEHLEQHGDSRPS